MDILRAVCRHIWHDEEECVYSLCAPHTTATATRRRQAGFCPLHARDAEANQEEKKTRIYSCRDTEEPAIMMPRPSSGARGVDEREFSSAKNGWTERESSSKASGNSLRHILFSLGQQLNERTVEEKLMIRRGEFESLETEARSLLRQLDSSFHLRRRCLRLKGSLHHRGVRGERPPLVIFSRNAVAVES